MEGDGVTLFNPSTFQNLAGDDDDKDDEEDQRHIEEQVTLLKAATWLGWH
jgi:hypothetical protein